MIAGTKQMVNNNLFSINDDIMFGNYFINCIFAFER